jgi:hypothetical protein
MRVLPLFAALVFYSLSCTNCPSHATCPQDGQEGNLTGQHDAGGRHFCDYTHDTGLNMKHHYSIVCDPE